MDITYHKSKYIGYDYKYKDIIISNSALSTGYNYTFHELGQAEVNVFTNIIDIIHDCKLLDYVMNNTFHHFNRYIYSLINQDIKTKNILSKEFMYEVLEHESVFMIDIYIGKLIIKTATHLGNDVSFQFIYDDKKVDYDYCSHHYFYKSKNNNEDCLHKCRNDLCDKLLKDSLSSVPSKSARY